MSQLRPLLGIPGAEERDRLLREGIALYDDIREAHFQTSRHKVTESDTGKHYIPWTMEESACLALALYARKQKEKQNV